MPAPKENKNGVKLKLPHIRKQAYQQYCQWISEGKPKKAWSFEHPQFTCTFRTLDKYIAENPVEFPPIHKEIAECKSYAKWFDNGVSMMMGEKEKCQPAIFQMIMRNMFGWDKNQDESKDSTEPLIKIMSKRWRGK